MLIGKMIIVHWDWGCRICEQTRIKNVKPLKNLKINWNRCFPVTSFDHDSNCTRPEASQRLWDDLSPPMIDPHNLLIYINPWNQRKKLSCARFRRSFSWHQDATTAWPKIRSFHQIMTHLIRTMMNHRKSQLEFICYPPFLATQCDLSIPMLPQLADLGLLRVVFEELQFSVFRYRICQHAIFHIHKVVEHLGRLEAATHLKLLLVTSQWGCGMPNTIFSTININQPCFASHQPV